MLKKMISQMSSGLALFLLAASLLRASAVNVMNYGADGMDYFQFTTPCMAFDKASGFTTLITFAMHVNADGTLIIAGVACTNGVYVGPTNWGSLVATLKTPPTTVTRYEVCIGGWMDTSFDNIKSLVASQGTGTSSILYKNFQALKNAVPGIDAINDDDEQTYDLNSATKFANMLGSLGYKFTTAPYQNQTFWVNLKNSITNCDYVYLQCYEGGAGNDPAQWQTALGSGVVVIPGQESNTAQAATNRLWYLETGVQGGFYYPDVVFTSTSWSAAIIEANGAAPAAPTGVVVTPGGGQLTLSWNVVPGAISYNVKRSTSSGGETTITNVSTGNNWPASNQYIDTGVTVGTTYYYKVSATNAYGESVNSVEVSAKPQTLIVLNSGFETSVISGYQYNPSGGSWTFNGSPGSGSGLIANGSAFGNPNAPQGGQAAFVQGLGTMSQLLTGLSPGATYTVTFMAAQRPSQYQHGGESWNVKLDNSVIASYNPGLGATTYAVYNVNFTATATTHTLSFVGTDLATGDNTVFIDNVRITMLSPVLQPVLNFGFETPSIGIGNILGSLAGGSWAFNLQSGLVGDASAFNNPNALEGIQAAFVQSYGVISQTLSGFTPGTNYTITFSAAQRSGSNQHGGQSWNVMVDNTVIGSYNPGSNAITYVNYTASFTATAATHTLSFVGTDLVTGDNTVFIDNVQIVPKGSVTVNNLSFEFDVTSPGTSLATVPTGWTAFNEGGSADIGSANAGGTDYTVNHPLATPAVGSQYCYVNMSNPSVTGGVYQDVGPLQTNTVYTLTVAIGSRKDRTNSPGIISLVNGTDNTGTVLVSGGGLPAATNAWQDYAVTYVAGAPVSGDLTIALSAIGSGTVQADFDNVRLTATPVIFKAPTFGASTVSGGNLILTGTGGTPNAGYTWLVTTNLAAPINWTTNSTGTLDGTGAFSNVIPINASQPASFLRLRMP